MKRQGTILRNYFIQRISSQVNLTDPLQNLSILQIGKIKSQNVAKILDLNKDFPSKILSNNNQLKPDGLLKSLFPSDNENVPKSPVKSKFFIDN